MRGLRLVLALLLALLALPRAGSAEERPQVVVVQTRRVDAYELALAGLRERLGAAVEVRVEMVGGEDAESGEALRELDPDVVVALGSKATAWAQQETREVPIVFLMVLNPVSSGLIPSMSRPGGRLTGASLDIPAALQFRMLRQLIDARRVAVLFNPAETGPVVRSARSAASREGVELVPIPVSAPQRLNAALEQVDRSFDALWSVADRTVFAHGAGKQILLHTLQKRLPFVGLSEPYVRAGALFALTTSYRANGRQAGELVLRVLAGEPVASIAVTVPDDVEVVYNPLTAKRLDLDLAKRDGIQLRAVK